MIRDEHHGPRSPAPCCCSTKFILNGRLKSIEPAIKNLFAVVLLLQVLTCVELLSSEILIPFLYTRIRS